MGASRPHLLVLSGRSTDEGHAIESLKDRYQVEVFRDAHAVVDALRSGNSYDAVFADAADFMPLERTLANEHASSVIESIGEGVAVFDEGGECVWASERMLAQPADVFDRVKQTCISLYATFAKQVGPRDDDDVIRSRKFGFQVGEDHFKETLVTPVIDGEGRVRRVVATVWDASTGRRLQQKIDVIDAAGRELVRLESESISRLNVGERLRLLEEKIIRFSRDLMRFDHFIIRLLNRKNNKLEPVIAVGVPPEALEVDLYAQPEGNGISGYVAVTGRSYICNDVEKDPRFVIGLDHAKSSLTVPLRLHDKVIGVFDIESQHPGAFGEDDRQFASIYGRYIAVALNILDLLVVERYTTSDRISENVSREMSTPLNDIEAEANALIDQVDNPQSVREGLDRILADVNKIRSAVMNVTQGPQKVLGLDEVEESGAKPLAGKCVMVADDEPAIRDTVAEMFSRLGVEQVHVAKDGHEAVHIIETHPLDLVVSDIRMPHRNGYEIYAATRRKSDTIPVILMTAFGYDPDHSIVRASQEGLQAVLFKPFKVDQLLEQVYSALNIEAPAKPEAK